MATRQKKIEFHFDTVTTDTVDATFKDFTQRTIYIPETVIGFDSVYVDFGYLETHGAATVTLDEHRIGVRLGAAAYEDHAYTTNYRSFGENTGYNWLYNDFTSYFTTNWSGTSMTMDVRAYFDCTTATHVMRNLTAKVVIVYRYDDAPATNATQIKTVKIPLESSLGLISTTPNTEIGTNQIPILTGASGLLREDSPVIRNYTFELGGSGNNVSTSSTDTNLSVAIDGGTTKTFGTLDRGGQGQYWWRLYYQPTVPTTTSAHAFQMWADFSQGFGYTPIVLVVTYEFNASQTVVNNEMTVSIEIPFDTQSFNYNSSNTFYKSDLDFYIPEPGTISLKQSAVRFYWSWSNQPASNAIKLKAGSQTQRQYTGSTASQLTSFESMIQRIDSGSDAGAGISIDRGKNTFSLEVSNTDAGDHLSAQYGVMYLNYTCEVPSVGIGASNNTIEMPLVSYANAARAEEYSNIDNSIPIGDSNYYINNLSTRFVGWAQTTHIGFSLDVSVLTGEYSDGSSINIAKGYRVTDNETGVYNYCQDITRHFIQWTGDPRQKRLDCESTRNFRLFSSASSESTLSAGCVLTKHAVTSSVACVTSNSTGTYNVNLHRSSDGEILLSESQTGDGTVNFTWFDNTENVYTSAQDSDNNTARGQDGLATLD